MCWYKNMTILLPYHPLKSLYFKLRKVYHKTIKNHQRKPTKVPLKFAVPVLVLWSWEVEMLECEVLCLGRLRHRMETPKTSIHLREGESCLNCGWESLFRRVQSKCWSLKFSVIKSACFLGWICMPAGVRFDIRAYCHNLHWMQCDLHWGALILFYIIELWLAPEWDA